MYDYGSFKIAFIDKFINGTIKRTTNNNVTTVTSRPYHGQCLSSKKLDHKPTCEPFAPLLFT